MAAITPYTYIQCPCSDPSSTKTQASEEEEHAFDPRAPRSNYSLYPLEYLLYCEDCHQIRCPRCIAEEIVTYYCPSCLFEVPGSNIRSDGNRCQRSCFQCPVCIGPLAVNAVDAPRGAEDEYVPPSYILSCSYCNWTSSEIGIAFDKPNSISSQLLKLRNGGRPRLTPKERKDRRKDTTGTITVGSGLASSALPPIGEEPAKEIIPDGKLDIETQFTNLKTFYQSQLAATSSSAGPGGLSSLSDLGIGSPGSLSRIMSLYTGTSSGLADKKNKSRTRVMREAQDCDEGLKISDLDESAAIQALLHPSPFSYGAKDESRPVEPWETTASHDQLLAQPPVNTVEADLHGRTRFLDQLRPVPYLLRTKRSKRCPVCRHIVSKPESKVSNTRFRIRLVAGSYIPAISMRPLQATSLAQPQVSGPGAPSSAPAPTASLLAPLRPVQYLLTFKNPIFESVRVTLATPAVTPGRFASKVTLLCPEFEIDANTDVWDEALKEGGRERRRRSGTSGGGQNQAEAGKVWERGRNWVTIVVEVVPASLRLDKHNMSMAAKGEAKELDLGPLREDEDILEIPMFVRVEWETDATAEEVSAASSKVKDGKEKRELSYWCALGIGRISQDY